MFGICSAGAYYTFSIQKLFVPNITKWILKAQVTEAPLIWRLNAVKKRLKTAAHCPGIFPVECCKWLLLTRSSITIHFNRGAICCRLMLCISTEEQSAVALSCVSTDEQSAVALCYVFQQRNNLLVALCCVFQQRNNLLVALCCVFQQRNNLLSPYVVYFNRRTICCRLLLCISTEEQSAFAYVVYFNTGTICLSPYVVYFKRGTEEQSAVALCCVLQQRNNLMSLYVVYF